MKKYSFDAVIFDLDGVITKTAVVHAGAWKLVFDQYLRLREKRDAEPFREFTHDGDYLPYVDGKPRYQGVQSFLESRGITLSFGQSQDPPDKETICGIGNSKNLAFCKVLQEQGVEVYPSTIQFINTLRDCGIRVGVASSSKNCQFTLESAGIADLFETRVDGEVSVQLGLKGKPEGDIFVTAARNLGAVPAKSIVVEDATSGVQAGRNGGFELVVGVARKDNQEELLANGADIVVGDLAAIDIPWIESWFHREPRFLLEFWDAQPGTKDSIEIAKVAKDKIIVNPCYTRGAKETIFNEKKPVLFLDYDGTLTPIVERPELALMSEEMRDVLTRLSRKCTVAIVSGRMREDVQKLVNIKGLFYAGSHGFDISGPGLSLIQPKAKQSIPLILQISKQLSKELGAIKGVLIEKKKFSVAVHYRLVAERDLAKIKNFVEETIAKHPLLHLLAGKKVLELLPDIQWDKAQAVRWIMQALKISWSQSSVVYIGDDVTDEYVFRVLRTRGIGFLVANKPRVSAADFQLGTTGEVKRLFEKLITFF